MVRRLRTALFALLIGSPALAQQADSTSAMPPEPGIRPGTVAVRIANEEPCPIAVRIKQTGGETRVGMVPPGKVSWMHLHPGDAGILEVEIVASPRACGLVLPSAPPALAPIGNGRRSAATTILVRRP